MPAPMTNEWPSGYHKDQLVLIRALLAHEVMIANLNERLDILERNRKADLKRAAERSANNRIRYTHASGSSVQELVAKLMRDRLQVVQASKGQVSSSSIKHQGVSLRPRTKQKQVSFWSNHRARARARSRSRQR